VTPKALVCTQARALVRPPWARGRPAGLTVGTFAQRTVGAERVVDAAVHPPAARTWRSPARSCRPSRTPHPNDTSATPQARRSDVLGLAFSVVSSAIEPHPEPSFCRAGTNLTLEGPSPVKHSGAGEVSARRARCHSGSSAKQLRFSRLRAIPTALSVLSKWQVREGPCPLSMCITARTKLSMSLRVSTASSLGRRDHGVSRRLDLGTARCAARLSGPFGARPASEPDGARRLRGVLRGGRGDRDAGR
jgi:hypothetical protein